MASFSSKIVIIAILVIAAVLCGYVVTTISGLTDQGQISNTTPVAQESQQSGIVDRHVARATNGPKTTNRSFLSENNMASVFSDVPESELNHELIEEYLRSRPIDNYRIVTVDSDLLRSRIRDSAENPTMSMRLLEDDAVKLTSSFAKEHSAGWQTGIGAWRGSVVDDDMSRASFIIGPDGSVSGEVMSMETGRIKVEVIKGTPHHLIWRFGEYDGPIQVNRLR